MFKLGDKVIIRKPKDTEEFPCWIPDMDEFDGFESEIEIITNTRGEVVVNIAGTKGYTFNTKWLEEAFDGYWRI